MLNVLFQVPDDNSILPSEIDPEYLNGAILVYSDDNNLRGQILFDPTNEVWMFSDKPWLDYIMIGYTKLTSEDLNDLCIKLNNLFKNLKIKIQHYE